MMPEGAPVTSASSTASRRMLYLPFIALGVFILGWSIFWFVMAQTADRVVDGFVQREAQRGRDWVCPNRATGGYPFRIEIRCLKPQLVEKTALGLKSEASLGELTLYSRILSPGHYIAVLKPPFVVRQVPDQEATLQWESAEASFRGGMQSFTDASFLIKQPVLSVGLGENRDQQSRAKEISIHLRRSPAERQGTDLVFQAIDISVPAFDQRIGNPDPLNLEFQATAPGLLLDPRQQLVQSVEAWRLAGGKARVVLAKANKGQAAIELTGTLGLDEERRPDGQLNGRARNIETLTSGLARRTGFDFGAIVGRLAGNQGIPVALTLDKGRVRFGPLNLVQLGPLY